MRESFAATVFALITDRALCLTCIATKAGMTEDVVNVVLAMVESRVRLFRARAFRCEACGVVTPVVSLSRPA